MHFTWSDVVKVDVNPIIAIRATLFMIESGSVHHFVNGRAEGAEAGRIQRDLLRATDAADVTRTTKFAKSFECSALRM